MKVQQLTNMKLTIKKIVYQKYETCINKVDAVLFIYIGETTATVNNMPQHNALCVSTKYLYHKSAIYQQECKTNMS